MDVKKKVLLIIMFVLLSSFASANFNWWNYGNIGYKDSSTGNTYEAFSSFFPSNHNLSNEFKCTYSSTPLFAPVIADINQDGINEVIIVTGTNYIKVIDFGCTELYSIANGEAITSMPSIRNVRNLDNPYQIIVQGTTKINFYRINDLSPHNLILDGYITNNGSGESLFSCENDAIINETSWCALWFGIPIYCKATGVLPSTSVECNSYTTTNTVQYRITYNASSTGYIAIRDTKVLAGSQTVQNYLFPFSDTAKLYYQSLNAIYSFYGLSNYTTTYKWFIRGVDQQSNSRILCTYSGSSTDSNYDSGTKFHVTGGSLGNSKQANFIGFSGISSRISEGDSSLVAMCDHTSVNRFSLAISGVSGVTEIVLADFNKDGYNEACYTYKVNSQTTFQCLDHSYTIIINATVNDLRNQTFSMALADFDNTNSFMEIVYPDGIYKYDAITDNVSKILNMNTTISELNHPLVIVTKDNTKSNYVLYAETTGLTIFGYGALNMTPSCGNGICDELENAFICSEDCLNNGTFVSGIEGLLPSGENCNADIECLTGKCLYGVCDYKSTGEGCTYDYECSSGDCMDNGACSKASLWQNIFNSLMGWFGDDETSMTLVGFFLVLILSVAVGVILGIYVGEIGAIIGFTATFYLTLIVFTIGGLINAWVFVIIILCTIALAVILFLSKLVGGN